MIKQFILDRIRVMNKYGTNRILIHIAGKKFGNFAILSHNGRKGGTVYQTPFIAEPIEGGFIIALTNGKKVDWLSSIQVEGSCSLNWKAKNYDLNQPEFIDQETGLIAF
jgi:hypothetical protein